MKMPFFHGVTDRLPDDGGKQSAAGSDDNDAGESQARGDGLHHHELHEDEGGGFHSKHTHPDGKVEQADHSSYDDARDHMNAMHGECDGEGDDAKAGASAEDDFDSDDMAGSYGRAAD